MYLGLVVAFALTLGSASAQSCGAYPLLDTKLSKCATATAFCESLLGRQGTTTTVSLGTYTKTVPQSTFTYLQVSTKTIRLATVLPTLSITSTLCAPTSAPAFAFNRMAQPAAAAAGKSCGLGGYSSAWVSDACGCAIDSTIYSASTTKKVKKGTSLRITSSTASYTTVSTSYSTTTTVTSTILSNNCYPPSNASCLYPGICGTYYTYYCGSSGYYECVCGLDANYVGTCFVTDYCDVLPVCTYDYDCAVGSFCLLQSCCDTPVCVVADVCVGDQGTTTSSPRGLATPAPVPNFDTNSGNKIDKRDKVFLGMTPNGPKYA